MVQWYSTSKLYEIFELNPPYYFNRNVFIYLSSNELIAMPQNKNIGLNIRNDIKYCKIIKISKSIESYEFNDYSLELFKEFYKLFPNTFKNILKGEIIEKDDPNRNANHYVLNLEDEEVNKILKWIYKKKKNYIFTLNDFIKKEEKIKKQKLQEPIQIKKIELNPKSYIQHSLNLELDQMISNVLFKLKLFQQKLKQKDPLNYKSKKRIVIGFREVIRAFKQNRLRSIIITPDIDDDHIQNVNEILLMASQKIPILFGLNMKRLGKSLGKSIKLTCVGIISADGSMDEYKKMIHLFKEIQNKK